MFPYTILFHAILTSALLTPHTRTEAFVTIANKRSTLKPSSSSLGAKHHSNKKSNDTMNTTSTSTHDHCVKLNNGVSMPCIGFGTYKLNKKLTTSKIQTALEAGYQMLDTAYVYGGQKTEGLVGEALQKSLESNSNFNKPFITTKVWRNHHGYEQTTQCLQESLNRLQLNQVDLVLIHWPGPAYDSQKKREMQENNNYNPVKAVQDGQEDIASLRLETWRALEDAYLQGYCRAIGVSNYSIKHLEKLISWKDIRIKPMVNQVEMHPYYNQKELRAYCSSQDIVIQAYSSLGGQDYSKKDYKNVLEKPPLLQNKIVLDIAKIKSKTPSQVLLRWAYQHGVAVIPKSENDNHIIENICIFDFTLSPKEMELLDGLDCGMKGRLTWRNDPLRNLDFD